MIATSAPFLEMVSTLSRTKRIAVDIEGSSRHHYPDQVSLIQIATLESIYIVDPLTDVDINKLDSILSNESIVKVFHGSDYDLRSLNRDWGFRLRSVYDTHVAARLGGYENVGLSSLIEEVLGVKIPKDPRIQKADWKRRPLTNDALEYAAQDVAYLLDLADTLNSVLIRQARQDWVEEECRRLANIYYASPDQESLVFNVKGSSTLDGRSLGVLKQLVTLRELEARRRDLPVAFVLSDAVMVAIASDPEAALETVTPLTSNARRTIGRRIMQSIQEGLKAGPISRPPVSRGSSQTYAQITKLKALKIWRKTEADILQIDPALVWSARSLERLARSPSTITVEMDAPEVRHWQKAQFGRSLRKFLEDLA